MEETWPENNTAHPIVESDEYTHFQAWYLAQKLDFRPWASSNPSL